MHYDGVSSWFLSNLLTMVGFTNTEKETVDEAETFMSSLRCKRNKTVSFQMSWNMDASVCEDGAVFFWRFLVKNKVKHSVKGILLNGEFLTTMVDMTAWLNLKLWLVDVERCEMES